jgi:hypothetical protein
MASPAISAIVLAARDDRAIVVMVHSMERERKRKKGRDTSDMMKRAEGIGVRLLVAHERVPHPVCTHDIWWSSAHHVVPYIHVHTCIPYHTIPSSFVGGGGSVGPLSAPTQREHQSHVPHHTSTVE